MSKVTRRVLGFVLLTFTIGLTTCSVLETVNAAPVAPVHLTVHV